MNLSQFLEHWSIAENPFRGEEARQDAVFARMAVKTDAPPLPSASAARSAAMHSDFEKILGELERPAGAIVFGEKGSGKTAIRLQIADRVAAFNAANPSKKILLIAYDDLNSALDRFHARSGEKDAGKAIKGFRLVDHMDALLALAVPGVVDAIMGASVLAPPQTGVAASASALAAGADVKPVDLGPDARKIARKLDPELRRDLLLLQALYDRPDAADLRTKRFRQLLRLPLSRSEVLQDLLAAWGWIIPVGLFAYVWYTAGLPAAGSVWFYAIAAVFALWLILAGKRRLADRFLTLRLAHAVRKQLRVIGRSDASLARSLRQLDPALHDPLFLPLSDSEDQRYAMLQRLRRVVRPFGYAGMIVIMDRVDEPTLVNGDPDRMRAIVWPLLNNKFLQQEGLGVKLLLPIELRHALFKESSSFFQEARLDKQNLIERLSWTGAMLYDLCDARLKACRPASAAPIGLLDLFAEDVTRKDLVDALDQMHQPRDAFKFLYACMVEHCSNVTAEENQFKIPRLVLDSVRKQQSDRVQQLYRGIRPA